jgi:hypothetical protein
MQYPPSQFPAARRLVAAWPGARPVRDRPQRHEEPHAGPYVLQFQAVEPRQQVHISSLLKLAGPFGSSRWVTSAHGRPDALVIGLGVEEGRAAWQANRLHARALPALLLGTAEQLRSLASRDHASVLLLSPPFRHLSLYYCLDVLARQCDELRAARADAGERCLRLVSYPPAALLKADPQHVRLASFLFAMPLSARELADLARCDPAVVGGFMQACDQAGLLRVASERRAAVAAREPSGTGMAPRMLGVLRRWLGL